MRISESHDEDVPKRPLNHWAYVLIQIFPVLLLIGLASIYFEIDSPYAAIFPLSWFWIIAGLSWWLDKHFTFDHLSGGDFAFRLTFVVTVFGSLAAAGIMLLLIIKNIFS